MPSTFLRAYPPAKPTSSTARWLLFRNSELLVVIDGDRTTLIDDVAALDAATQGEALYLGTLGDTAYMAYDLGGEAPLSPAWQPIGLRALYGKIDEEEYSIAGYASQMLLWQRSSRFCPVCGSPTEQVGGDWGRRCTVCGYTRYPQISPAVLALVHNGDHVLLTHKPGWGQMYSIIAGFVEPNESLEHCVHREVAEEAGVLLGEIVYGGSQGWPFPAQLMIGFLCEYSSGEIAIDEHELDDAKWFHVDELPLLPAPLSLSRQLLNRWILSRRPDRV